MILLWRIAKSPTNTCCILCKFGVVIADKNSFSLFLIPASTAENKIFRNSNGTLCVTETLVS